MTQLRPLHRAWRLVRDPVLKGIRIVAPFALFAFPIALVRHLTQHPDWGTIVLSLAATVAWGIVMLRLLRRSK